MDSSEDDNEQDYTLDEISDDGVSSVLKQKKHCWVQLLMNRQMLLNLKGLWRRKILLLKVLMGTKKWQNPRCQTYHVIHPYIPGMKILHYPTRLTRRRKER